MHILSPETDNCPSWISGRERTTVENISWSISTKECCRPRRGLNPRPPGLQSDGASNWATEASTITCIVHVRISLACWLNISTDEMFLNLLLFSPENRLWHFVQIVSSWNVKAYFLEKKNRNNISTVSSAEFANRVVKVNTLILIGRLKGLSFKLSLSKTRYEPKGWFS